MIILTTARPDAAGGRPAARRWRLPAAAGVAAVLLSGCATVPDSGSVQPGSVAAAGQDYLLQPVIEPPKPNWSPAEVVSGFLQATASFAHGYAAARQYLTPAEQRSWDPAPSWSVKVIIPHLRVTEVQARPQQQSAGKQPQANVRVAGQQLAMVTREGQYVGSQGPASYTWQALLDKVGGQWRIVNPPSPPPLYEFDFQRVYLPRDLYFLTPSGQTLVPDPIFVPLQATSVEVAQTLVSSLQANLPDWLSGGAATALAGTQLLGKVTINAGTATVDLGGAAAAATPSLLSQMMAQLVWTLASPAYGQAAIAQSVELEIDGQPRQLASWSGGQPQQDGRPLASVPLAPAHQPLYSLTGSGTLQRLAVPSLSATRIPVRAGDGGAPAGSIAVSPDGRYVAEVTRTGSAVYYGALKAGARLAGWSHGGRVISASWDVSDDLWVVTSTGIWMLGLGGSATPLGGLPAQRIVSMQVAPDGVRAAMIVTGPHGNQLLLAAIVHLASTHVVGSVALGPTVSIGAQVPNPVQLTWYDPDDLIVLSTAPDGPLLEEVPVNGASPVALTTDPGTQSISAAGPANANPLVAGLPGGQLALTYSLNGTWLTKHGAGQDPTYPG